jgi:hypothetical protein
MTPATIQSEVAPCPRRHPKSALDLRFCVATHLCGGTVARLLSPVWVISRVRSALPGPP